MIADSKDETIKKRAEFMFNYLDFNSDRTPLRNKFIDEMNKKTTL